MNSNDDRTTLLPCPFCGGPAEMNVGCFGERFVTCGDDNCGGRRGLWVWESNEQDAIKTWNRRLWKKEDDND